MPTIIIYEAGHEPIQVRVEEELFGIGRAESNDVVLPHPAVSRFHVKIRQVSLREFQLEPVGQDKRVVVNGAQVRGPVRIREGAEIGIGPYVLLFSLKADAMAFYQGRERGALTVPEEFESEQRLKSALETAKESGALSASTTFMDHEVLERFHRRIAAAQKSWIQNVEPGPDGRIHTIHLTENRICRIGKGKDVDLRLKGLVLGSKPTTIKWKGAAYVVEHFYWFPKMRINGEAKREHRLRDSDLIQIGRNLFRFRSKAG